MLRAFVWVVLLSAVALVAAPIMLASLYVDQRGVALTGHVYSKILCIGLLVSCPLAYLFIAKAFQRRVSRG